jgi:hypothetical protein
MQGQDGHLTGVFCCRLRFFILAWPMQHLVEPVPESSGSGHFAFVSVTLVSVRLTVYLFRL